MRDRVQPVRPISAVDMDVSRPRENIANGSKSSAAQTGARPDRAIHSAMSAAAGFAASVLVEAGLAGSDPSQSVRALRAYGRADMPVRLRAIA
jgi:hypothetical protein